MTRALILDCDGVLADTERYGHLVAFNKTFEEFGLPVRWTVADYQEKLRIGGGKERMASLLTPSFVARAGLPADMPRDAEAWIPIDQAESITQFALVPSLFACCFGQPPQVQHTVVCKAPQGKAVSYYPDELVIEGKLKVEEKKDEGFIVSIFEVDVTSVKPAAK